MNRIFPCVSSDRPLLALHTSRICASAPHTAFPSSLAFPPAPSPDHRVDEASIVNKSLHSNISALLLLRFLRRNHFTQIGDDTLLFIQLRLLLRNLLFKLFRLPPTRIPSPPPAIAAQTPSPTTVSAPRTLPPSPAASTSHFAPSSTSSCIRCCCCICRRSSLFSTMYCATFFFIADSSSSTRDTVGTESPVCTESLSFVSQRRFI